MNQLDVIKDMWVMISSDIDNLIDYMPMFVASKLNDPPKMVHRSTKYH